MESLRFRAGSLTLVFFLLLLFPPCVAAQEAPDADPLPRSDDSEARRRQRHDRAGALFEKGFEHYRAGRYEEATTLIEQSVDQMKGLYPEESYPRGHPDLAIGLQTLGVLFQTRGDAARARRYYEEALDMRRRFYDEAGYPRGHPELAESLERLALLVQSQGEYGAARRLYEEALSMLTRLYPEAEHPGGHARIATTLYNLASLLEARSELGEARRHYERSLAMWRHLYPAREHPDGNSRLASSLESLGAVCMAQGESEDAKKHLEEALRMRQRLYDIERYPRGHSRLASSLNSLGDLLRSQGEYSEARAYYESALAMRRRLFPESEHPRGHRSLAQSLSGLGVLLRAQGEYGEAKRYYEEALAMYRQLYPPGEYPRGHPYLAAILTNLAVVLGAGGDHDAAKGRGEEALAMYRRLYPASDYPRGHRHVVASLTNLGLLRSRRGDLEEARQHYEEALAMDRRLYPGSEYPDGHNELAGSLSNLGLLLADQGEFEDAVKYSREALAMTRRLYAESEYPIGHPDLAQRVGNLGMVLQVQGDEAAASGLFLEAARMRHEIAAVFFAGSSEAEALNFAAAHLETPHRLISTWRGAGKSGDDLYAAIWTRRGAIQRLLSTRRKLLEESTAAAAVERYEEYLDVRRQLAGIALAPADPEPGRSGARRERLESLSDRKETLERTLAAALPAFRRQLGGLRRPHTDLARTLPEGRVFVDIVYYVDIEPGADGRKTPSYVAFIARRGEAVRRVDLGPAAPIDAAVEAWRKDIRGGTSTVHAADLRRSVWKPLEARFGSGETTTVYLALDGSLSVLPWAALRGRTDGTVLLEDHAIATVPSGHLLLEQLETPPPAVDATDRMLAVGDVRYDRREDAPRVSGPLALVRAEERGRWLDLPATKDEVKIITDLARESGRGKVRTLSGTRASPGRVLRDLPRARWAHLATHGFFASAEFRSKMSFDPRVFETKESRLLLPRERTTTVGRNPLVLSGLVLAGANLPPPRDEYGITRGDDGILTAESIAAMRLEGLELAVLSACETGLGEVAAGEGVYGLQRAFHQAGTRNVIASLWKVDDEATAALMRLFYHGLWVEKRPAIEALRRAQLAIYRQPQTIRELSRTRGDFDPTRIVKLSADAGDRREEKTAPVRLWAAFSLSGAGE